MQSLSPKHSAAWRQAWDSGSTLFALAIFLKFVVFDVIWCSYTTFVPFSTLESYVTKLLATLVLVAPMYWGRMWRLQTAILLLLDVWLVANLMYYRTYYTAIPPANYLLVSNLDGFMGSVFDSFRWVDVLFPLLTVGTVVAFLRLRRTERVPARRRILPYGVPLLVLALTFGVATTVKGGFMRAVDQVRQSAYLCSSTPCIYSLFGHLCFELWQGQQELTPEVRQSIDQWLARRPALPVLPDSVEHPVSCIVILAESLESWVLGQTVEGQEITPCLNRLLAEPSTLYAPHVLTQVKGGRSIDAQLLVCTGLLPLNSGCYSSLYPDNDYPSLPKALHQAHDARAYLLTIDKLSTWNQGMIARSFGTDTILAYPDFELTEAFGTHKRIGDRSFFSQCRQKMERGEIWPAGQPAYLQMVTYSGHAPFKLPEHLQELTLADSIPEKARDYMQTAHYTDSAIGQFVDYLKTRPDYAQTMVVIMGDHEGLAGWRPELHEAVPWLVPAEPFTPLVVLNSPLGMRHEGVMGQVDIYPTLLGLLGLEDYRWAGLGQSILDPTKQSVAVGSHFNVVGQDYTPAEAERLRQAHDVSDAIIRFDYLRED